MLVLPAFPQDELPRSPEDHSKLSDAISDWMKKAEQGEASAQAYVGLSYELGQGVPHDYLLAARWYKAAAEQGHALAQFNLGAMYDYGRGVPQDYIQAHLWYDLAATDLVGDEKDQVIERRKSLAEKMTSEQIAEAKRLAREWKPKNIDRLIGLLKLEGLSMTEDGC